MPAPIAATIVRLKREYPGWGAPKIREKLRKEFTGPHLPVLRGMQLGDELVHSTTVATNALLTRSGGPAVLVTTAGFEDVLEIGRQARPKA